MITQGPPKKYREPRRVLIDPLDGAIHRGYGAMPNVVYVINPEGIAHYRRDWTHIEGLRRALTERDHIHTDEHADMHQLNAGRLIRMAVRTMWTGGLLALWDFIVATPALIKRHRMIDESCAKHGRFRNRPE